MLTIEIWSDYACPYCYIGKTQLKQVLEEMGVKDVAFRHRVFLLEPGKVNRPDQTFVESLNITDEGKMERLVASFQSMTDMAAEVGLDYKVMEIPNVATINAHRLTLRAEDQGKGEALSDKIFEAYFEKALDISDPDLLAQLAQEVGVDMDQVGDYLTDESLKGIILDGFEEAEEKQIDLVPHFYFNGNHDVIGVTTKPLLREAVGMALEDLK